MYRETLDEYMASYEEQEAKIERYDKRIEEIAAEERYQKNARKLGCFLGISTHTALYALPKEITMQHTWV